LRRLGELEFDVEASVGATKILSEFRIVDVPGVLTTIVHTPIDVSLLVRGEMDRFAEVACDNSLPVNLSLLYVLSIGEMSIVFQCDRGGS